MHIYRAIPAGLGRVMRAAGVPGWRICRTGAALTHEPVARSCGETARAFDAAPANLARRRRVAPFLAAGPCDATPDPAGDLIWDFS
jgi:hypothetical protein